MPQGGGEAAPCKEPNCSPHIPSKTFAAAEVGAPNAIHLLDRGASICQLHPRLCHPGSSSAPITTTAAPIPFSAHPTCTSCGLASLPHNKNCLPPDGNIMQDRVQSIANHGTHGCVPRSTRGFTPWCVSFLACTKRYESMINLCFTTPATYIFTKFVPNKLNNYLRYATVALLT